MLERIAKNRACLMKGGELDLARASALLLDEFVPESLESSVWSRHRITQTG